MHVSISERERERARERENKGKTEREKKVGRKTQLIYLFWRKKDKVDILYKLFLFWWSALASVRGHLILCF